MDSAILVKANLEDADLTGADLGGAVMTKVKATGALLVDAFRVGADLTGAMWVGADVSGLVTVEAEDFRGAEWNDDTQLHPDMNTNIMVYVSEPGGTLSLVVGVSSLAMLGRSRSRG